MTGEIYFIILCALISSLGLLCIFSELMDKEKSKKG